MCCFSFLLPFASVCVCVSIFFFFNIFFFHLLLLFSFGLAVPWPRTTFVTRRGGLATTDPRSTLATSPVRVESSNWDTVSAVLGGFLSVSIRLDAYLWNTCGARRVSVLASSISGCTCICAPGRRPSCTASRRRRSVAPVVINAFDYYYYSYFKEKSENLGRVELFDEIEMGTSYEMFDVEHSIVPCAVSFSSADSKSCHNYPNTWQVLLVVDSDIRSRYNTPWCAPCDTSVLQQKYIYIYILKFLTRHSALNFFSLKYFFLNLLNIV